MSAKPTKQNINTCTVSTQTIMHETPQHSIIHETLQHNFNTLEEILQHSMPDEPLQHSTPHKTPPNTTSHGPPQSSTPHKTPQNTTSTSHETLQNTTEHETLQNTTEHETSQRHTHIHCGTVPNINTQQQLALDSCKEWSKLTHTLLNITFTQETMANLQATRKRQNTDDRLVMHEDVLNWITCKFRNIPVPTRVITPENAC